MTLEQIIVATKALLDEFAPSGSGLLVGDSQDKPIEAYIEASLSPTWIDFVNACPIHLLPSSSNEGAAATADGVYSLTLPDGFIRPITFKLPSWAYEVEPVTIQHPLYLMQKNSFTMGTAGRPVAIWKEKSIEAYVAKNGEKGTLLFVGKITFASGEDLIPARISDAFCCNVASNVYLAMKNITSAEAMLKKRDSML